MNFRNGRLYACARTAWHVARAVRHAFVTTLAAERHVNCIRRSPLFDADWYLANNSDVAANGMDPAYHYLTYGVLSNRNPSPHFVNEEYYALNTDVRSAGLNPLLHYELFGRREGRAISLLDAREPTFPDGCVSGEWTFGAQPRRHGRTAVVASYFGDGVIPPALVYFLRGLRGVTDNIVYVADCPVRPEEVEKLRGIVTVAKFERHGQYDFGSYRRGLAIARAKGLLAAERADELVVANDSCYGPVYPFAEGFAKMAARDVDFWGYMGYKAFGSTPDFIQSFFYVFRRRVIDSGKLDEFLGGVRGKIERDKVIAKFEWQFTRFLAAAGFRWDCYAPIRCASAKYPLTMIRDYRIPLLKVKAVNGDSRESIPRTLAIIRRDNPELAALIRPRKRKVADPRVSYADHQASFPAKCARLAAKMAAGEKIRAVFFVFNPSLFPARPLFDAMLRDGTFDPSVCVIPDLRWHDGGEREAMARCAAEMAACVPKERLAVADTDEFGNWLDMLEGADLVCYPSPYELSSFRYNPRYAVGRDFLPITVNYGFYRSLYDRHVMQGQSYAWMWKAFFECDETLAEYRAYSAVGGVNGDLAGYIKMDALAAVRPAPHARRRILVAPHHSVEGGTNKMLALSNFAAYSAFFSALPDRYPEIDFVFRPHPYLFKVLARPVQWGPRRVEEYIAGLRAKPNVIWSDGGDYFREFAESDACIQDCGSYLVEYFYTGRPCCYMLKSPGDIDAKFAPLGQKCLEQCYLAYDTDAIDAFIREVVVGGKDPKREARAAFAKRIMVNYPHAADVALAHIKAGLRGS